MVFQHENPRSIRQLELLRPGKLYLQQLGSHGRFALEHGPLRALRRRNPPGLLGPGGPYESHESYKSNKSYRAAHIAFHCPPPPGNPNPSSPAGSVITTVRFVFTKYFCATRCTSEDVTACSRW